MLSVIIPVYNEPEGLKQTLDSFLQQRCPKDQYEVIVVDNGSTDNTYELACAYQQQHPAFVRALREDKLKGSYAARNKGLSIARGELICFIDADMTVYPDYLDQIKAVFASEPVDYVGCKVEVYSDKNTLASKYNRLNGFRVDSDLKHNQFVPTCCLSVKRTVFDKVGLFDYRLESGGDYEFGQRIFKAGYRQHFADHIVVRHPARWKYTSLVNKSRRIARGIAQLYAYQPDIYRKDYLKYFNKKRHLPKNPLRIYKKAKALQLPLTFFEVLALSFYHVPISFISTKEVKKAYSKLKSQGM